MNILYSKIVNQKIVSRVDKRIIANVFDIALDISNGKLQGLLIKKFNLFNFKKLIILPQDIINWNEYIHIYNLESLNLPEDIIRLRNIFDDYVNLIDIPVITEGNSSLGTVEDYSLDIDNFYLKKLILSIGKDLKTKIRAKNLIIDKNNIVSISEEKIIVKDPHIKTEREILQVSYIPEPSF